MNRERETTPQTTPHQTCAVLTRGDHELSAELTGFCPLPYRIGLLQGSSASSISLTHAGGTW